MSFTSVNYYIFLICSYAIFNIISRRWRNKFLLLASIFFYLSFDPRYLLFLLVTILVSYSCAHVITTLPKQRVRKAALVAAIFVELLMLGLTKYWNPLAQSTKWFSPINILIPLGISFYTFQSIGYLTDVYRGTIKLESNFIRYALFLGFFPHLLAGPIEPAKHFLPQIQDFKNVHLSTTAAGIFLIVTGLMKKLIIADRLKPIVDIIFNNPQDQKGLSVALGAILARFQIYNDFSGYTDIAIGSALLFGINLTKNFNRPFFSASISEYWRRWHISLSIWIRDYIFYPLLATKVSQLGVNFLIMFTFLALGLWHGGTMNFILYGAIQGLFVITDYQTKKMRLHFYQITRLDMWPKTLKSICIFNTFFFLVVPPTILFRSQDTATSWILYKNLISSAWSLNSINFIFKSPYLVQCLSIGLVAIILYEFFDWIHSENMDIANFLLKKSIWLFGFVMLTFLAFIIVFGNPESRSQFIYMQF